jgi:hypothetical protein
MFKLQKALKGQCDYCGHIVFVRLELDFRNGSAFPIAKLEKFIVKIVPR